MITVKQSYTAEELSYLLQPAENETEYHEGATFRIQEVSLFFSGTVETEEDFVISKKTGAVTEELYRIDMNGVYSFIILNNKELPLIEAGSDLLFEFPNTDGLSFNFSVRYGFYINISLWRSDLIFEFDGLTETEIDKAILNTCRDFCEKTCLWTVESPQTDMIAGQAEYRFIDLGGEVVGIDYVKINNSRIEPTTETQLDTESLNWRENQGSPTKYITGSNRNIIRLIAVPSYSEEQSIIAGFYLKPLKDSSEIPTFLYDAYSETLNNGAKARLYRRRDGDGDLNKAEYHNKLYQQERNSAFVKKAAGFTKASYFVTTERTF